MNIEPVIEKEVSQKESQIFNIYIYIYMESRKILLMNLFAQQEQRRRIENRLMDTMWEGEYGTNRENNLKTHTLP